MPDPLERLADTPTQTDECLQVKPPPVKMPECPLFKNKKCAGIYGCPKDYRECDEYNE
jgi:hypothetical protein